MICEICEKNQATTLGEIEGQNKYLCTTCYKKFVNNNDLTDIVEQVSKQTSIDLFCNNCGATLDDIQNSGLFGCEKCYDTFRNLLDNSQEQFNNYSVPKLFEVKQKIDNYNSLIERAISRQDYETVKNLSSKIDALRSEYDARI